MSRPAGEAFRAVEARLAREGRLARADAKPAKRRTLQAAPEPQARYDPVTGELLNEPSPSDRLRDALAEMDTRGGLRGAHEVSEAFRLGAHADAPFGLALHNGTEIVLGDADRILNQPRKIKAAIAAAIGVSLTLPKDSAAWDTFYEHLHAAAAVRDVTLSEAEETCEWISSYLNRHQRGGKLDLSDPEHLARAVSQDDPFRSTDHQLYLRLASLVRHVCVEIGQRTAQHDASERLGTLGFRRLQLSARVDGEPRKRRYWASPPGFDPDADPASPITLSDQTARSSVGTRGRGDEPANTDDPHGHQRPHVGTPDHDETAHTPSVNGQNGR